MNSLAMLYQSEVLSPSPKTQLRLREMLSYLGIDQNSYFDKVPSEQISAHLINCATCTDTSACDYCISDRTTVSEMNFCSNFPSLVKYRRSLMDEI
jgi:hypothetical protein